MFKTFFLIHLELITILMIILSNLDSLKEFSNNTHLYLVYFQLSYWP